MHLSSCAGFDLEVCALNVGNFFIGDFGAYWVRAWLCKLFFDFFRGNFGGNFKLPDIIRNKDNYNSSRIVFFFFLSTMSPANPGTNRNSERKKFSAIFNLYNKNIFVIKKRYIVIEKLKTIQ